MEPQNRDRVMGLIEMGSTVSIAEMHTVMLGLICHRLGLTSDEIIAGINEYMKEKVKVSHLLDSLTGDEGGYHA